MRSPKNKPGKAVSQSKVKSKKGKKKKPAAPKLGMPMGVGGGPPMAGPAPVGAAMGGAMPTARAPQLVGNGGAMNPLMLALMQRMHP